MKNGDCEDSAFSLTGHMLTGTVMFIFFHKQPFLFIKSFTEMSSLRICLQQRDSCYNPNNSEIKTIFA